MAAVAVYSISCDAPGCTYKVSDPDASSAEVNMTWFEVGGTHNSLTNEDFCPNCSERIGI